MVEITEFIIIIAAIFGFSVLCAFTKKGFSMGIFLTGISVCISILIWKEVLPYYTIIFPVFIIVGLLFGDKMGMSSEEDGGSVE